MKQTLYRVTAPDFCVGLVYDFDPPICIKAAPRVGVFLNHGPAKLLLYAKAKGWTVEIIPQTEPGSADKG